MYLKNQENRPEKLSFLIKSMLGFLAKLSSESEPRRGCLESAVIGAVTLQHHSKIDMPPVPRMRQKKKKKWKLEKISIVLLTVSLLYLPP